MAEGDAEKRKIAELYFGTSQAETNLKTINEKLDEIVKKTANLNLGNNLSIDTSKIKSNYKNLDEMIAKYGKNVTNTYLKGVNIAEKAEKDKEVAAYKSTLKQEEYNKRIEKSTKSLYDKITEYAKTYVIYQGFNALKQAASETIDEMVNVEYQMVQIDRVMNVAGMNINDFRDDLIQLAYDYGNSFDNVADISLRLAQAGIKGTNNLALTEKTLLALNTAELDATQATDDMVAVMSQWNLITNDATQTAKEYGDIIDKVNKVADNFPVTSSDILEALKKTSSAFNLAGASINETIASIVAAEKASQRGGKVIGTALSNIAQQLKTDQRISLAESLGVEIFEDDAKTTFKPIMEIFQSLSDKMQELKNEGKDASKEMQDLLGVFTVFRRNIGSSLLGEMAGEESTYANVLKTVNKAIGYSYEENTKHMKTAKAAQEQFNATLLQLKTQVWDNKAENVYRDLLNAGTDIVKWINDLSKDMKLLPSIVAVATTAFSLLSKKIDYNSLKKYTNSLKEVKVALQLYNDTVGKGEITSEEFSKIMGKDIPKAVSNYTKGLNNAEASMSGLIAKTVLQTAKQLALNIAIAAGEAALSFGLSIAIQAIVTAIDSWVHQTEKATESLQKMNDQIETDETDVDNYSDKFRNLRKELDDLNTGLKDGTVTQEEYNSKKKELKDLQEELIKKYGSEADGINLVTGAIEKETEAIEQLKKANYQKYIQENQKSINDLTNTLNKSIDVNIPSFFKYTDGTFEDIYDKLFNYLNENFAQMSERYSDIVTMADVAVSGTPEEQLEYFRAMFDGLVEYRENIYQELSEEDKKYLDDYIIKISNTISDLNNKYSEAITEYKEYLNNRLKYDNFYSETYAKILKARADVADAEIKKDPEALEKAKENLQNVYQQAIEKASSDSTIADDMVDLLKKQLDNANEDIEKEGLGIKIGVQGDKLFDDIQEILNKVGDISLEDFKTQLTNAAIQTKFGNIDILREGITWDTDSIEKYREQLEELNLNLDELEGSYSNILGASQEFNTEAGSIEVAYSPMLQTENGLIPLYQDEVNEYIQEVINKAQEEVGSGKYNDINEAILAIDSEGIEDFVSTTGDKIKGLIADVGDTAVETGEKMHENWQILEDAGGTTENMQDLRDILDENGISVEQLTEYFEYLGFTLENNKQSLTGVNDIISQSILREETFKNKTGMVSGAMSELETQGYLTASSLQDLINNDLLRYFDLSSGKITVNSQKLLDLAEAERVAAINALEQAQAQDISNLAAGKTEELSKLAKSAITNMGNAAQTAGGKMSAAAAQANLYAAGLQNIKQAEEGNLGAGVDPQVFKTQANAIINAYQAVAKNISASIKGATFNSQKATRASSASSNAAEAAAKRAAQEAERAAEKAAQEAEKAAQEIYKNSLAQFKNYMTEFERLEKRWVTKQKDLGLLGTDDYLYITEQKIKRYQEYLDEIRKATWLNDEDRLELEKKYTEGLEDLQVDYLDYVKDKLDEEIKALEDANDKKIDTIKEEAKARIDALKKVEKETDRIREKEEYERKRAEHLEDISYWEQRTGREAQEALKEARAKLEELDREWQEQQEDWNIDDQIKAIEDERDAQVKAIEDAQQAEIDAMKAVYDAKVKMFAETGEIIYENSVMQSQNLYNAYKKNFIDPVASDLSKLNQTLATNVTESSAKSNEGASENKVSEPEQQYETYKIKSGDTLTKIARQYGTTIEKILEANPYVTNKNKIYTGKTLQIPKFHEGGIVGGNQEGFALLKPNEVVLRPDWADGITKLAKMARQKENAITTNSTVIEVKGDLVKLEANIKDKTDAEYLTKRIEKVLKDKFNIKK